MKEIEEIWDEHRINQLFNKDSIELPNRITSSELDKLSKVLKIEIFIGVFLALVLVILRERINEFAFIMSITIAVCGLAFSCHGYYLNKKVRIEDNSLLFLNSTLRVLKHFIIKYLVVIQILLIGIYIAFGITNVKTTFINWAVSNLGVKTIVVILIVDIICLLYGYFFYVKKYLRLKKILKA